VHATRRFREPEIVEPFELDCRRLMRDPDAAALWLVEPVMQVNTGLAGAFGRSVR